MADSESQVAAPQDFEKSLKAQLAELEAKAGDLTAERDGHASKASGLAQTVATLEARLKQQTAATEAAHKELQFTADRLEPVKLRRNEFQGQAKESAAALNAANSEIEFLNGRLERVKQRRDEFQAEAKSMVATADAAAKQIEFLNGRLERVKVRRDEFRREAKARESELDHWRSLEEEHEQVVTAIQSLKDVAPQASAAQ